MQLKILSGLFLVALSPGLIDAASVSYTTTQTFGPGSMVTYTEAVGGANLISPTPWRSESSVGCATLSTSGCVMASFTDTLAALNIPQGAEVTSAYLNLVFQSQLSDSGLISTAVTQIVPQQYYGLANPGTHGDTFQIDIDTAAGNLKESGSQSLSASGVDYTSIVQAALAQGTGLAPISVEETLIYGISDFYSVRGGANSYSVFNEDFQISDASLTTVLTVYYTAVPEPATLAICGGVLLLASFFKRR